MSTAVHKEISQKLKDHNFGAAVDTVARGRTNDGENAAQVDALPKGDCRRRR